MAVNDDSLLALPEDRAISLAGPPGTLRVNLPFANPGAAPVIVRDVAVRAAERQGARALPRLSASVTLGLLPDQAATAPLLIHVDPQTPPGEYSGEIMIAGTVRRLDLTIIEEVRLSVAPNPVLLDRGTGDTVRKTVLFGNEGNVPLRIGGLGEVSLGEELPLATAVTAEIAADDRPGRIVKELFGRLLDLRDRPLLREVATMRVRLPGGGFVLEPGTVRSAAVECLLPPDLLPHRRYRAYYPLYQTELSFLIVTAGDTPQAGDREEPREKPRRRAAAGRRREEGTS